MREIKKGSVGSSNKENNISLMKPIIIHSITSALQALKLPLQASNTLSQYQTLKTASVQHLTLEYLKIANGPYSLFVCASYFISCSIHAPFAFVTFVNCKWRWGCRHFLTSRISIFCIEAIELIIK